MLTVQLRHLVPQRLEVLGVSTMPSPRSDELPLVHPPSVPTREAGNPEGLALGFDLTGRGRDHLADPAHGSFQNVVEARVLRRPPDGLRPPREAALHRPPTDGGGEPLP